MSRRTEIIREVATAEGRHDHFLGKLGFSRTEDHVHQPREVVDHEAALHHIYKHLTTHGYEHSTSPLPSDHYAHSFHRGGDTRGEAVHVVMKRGRIKHVETE